MAIRWVFFGPRIMSTTDNESIEDFSRRTSRTTNGSPRSPLKNAYDLVRTSPEEHEQDHELIFADVIEALGGTVKFGTESVSNATILRLSWLGFSRLGDGLLGLGSSLHDLYLQHNRLTKIEGLDSLVNLEFLALQGNRIRKIEGLTHLIRLKALDLSDNLIESLPKIDNTESLHSLHIENNEENESLHQRLPVLPLSIRIFNGLSNPMTLKEGYKDDILMLLPNLIRLDNVNIVLEQEEKNENEQENKKLSSVISKSPTKKDINQSPNQIESISMSVEVTSEATQFALDEAVQRYQSRKENLTSLFAARIEVESARSIELARLVDEQGKADLDSARRSLSEFREGAVARSKERANEHKKRTQSVQEALDRAEAAAEDDGDDGYKNKDETKTKN